MKVEVIGRSSCSKQRTLAPEAVLAICKSIAIELRIERCH
jgi:hypothetical protein